MGHSANARGTMRAVEAVYPEFRKLRLGWCGVIGICRAHMIWSALHPSDKKGIQAGQSVHVLHRLLLDRHFDLIQCLKAGRIITK